MTILGKKNPASLRTTPFPPNLDPFEHHLSDDDLSDVLLDEKSFLIYVRTQALQLAFCSADGALLHLPVSAREFYDRLYEVFDESGVPANYHGDEPES